MILLYILDKTEKNDNIKECGGKLMRRDIERKREINTVQANGWFAEIKRSDKYLII
jgi:hypothetical protein